MSFCILYCLVATGLSWLASVQCYLTCKRLVSPSLPTSSNLRRVVEQYFANVHPLRCFAFVHKPSFMRQLDNGLSSDDESALLHIICAHGAKYVRGSSLIEAI